MPQFPTSKTTVSINNHYSYAVILEVHIFEVPHAVVIMFFNNKKNNEL